MNWIFLFFILIFSCDALFSAPIQVPQEFYEKWFKIDQHPGFEPFISHVDFRKVADYAIDQSTEYFDPDQVKQGDSVYVNVWLLQWFEEFVHDHIKYPYVLISCDVGDHVPNLGSHAKLLYDPKCAAWFCRNIIFSYHPKLCQIPWGQDLWYWDRDSSMVDLLKNAVSSHSFEKKYLLYMNHFPRSFGDRDKIVQLFENAPFCFTRNTSHQSASEYAYIPRSQYYEELGSAVFALSPLGLETDSVRTWEAFVMECIPIVEHTFLDSQYEGLPIVIVHDWEEITEEFLLAKYEELKNKSTEKAYFDYWRQQIKERQNWIRNHDLDSSRLETTQFTPKELYELSETLKKSGSRHCIYRGSLTTLRPLQLANSFDFIDKIFLYDPWFNSETGNLFKNYLVDHSVLKNAAKIFPLSSDARFDQLVAVQSPIPIFLDLLYYRNNLLRNPVSFRHSLKKEILELYQRMQKGTLLCGNMASENYVKKVLHLLSAQDQLPVEINENMWSIVKK